MILAHIVIVCYLLQLGDVRGDRDRAGIAFLSLYNLLTPLSLGPLWTLTL